MRRRLAPEPAAALATAAIAAALLALLHHSSPGASWFESLALAIPLGVLYAFLAWVARFPCRATPLDQASLARLVVTHGTAALAMTTVWVGVGRLVAVALERALGPGVSARFQERATLLVALGALGYGLAVAAHYSVAAARSSRDATWREREARALQRESELRTLRQQVSPHFLFNCLNTISALVAAEPAAARHACERLAELLRRTLTMGEADRVTLDEELQVVAAFLDLEQLRFGDRLRAAWDVEPAARRKTLPPLLLLPLVENAVTHGIATLVDGGEVAIRARLIGERLAIAVDNPRDEADGGRRERVGLGIEHARRRLQVVFGPSASLRIRQRAADFHVDLEVPAEEAV